MSLNSRRELADFLTLPLEHIDLRIASGRFATSLEEAITSRGLNSGMCSDGYDVVTATITYDLVVPEDADWPQGKTRINNDSITLLLIRHNSHYRLALGDRMKLYEFLRDRRSEASLPEEKNKDSFHVFVVNL
ncbi:hypothetical protein HYX10_00005 [Candidatus Woesearchaeota archaeon]|nr:hypothetical protein [Candidatus Woesearchaeota archaeon]